MEHVASLYSIVIDRKSAFSETLISDFAVNSPSPHDHDLHGWIHLFVLKNIPISHVEDPEIWTWLMPATELRSQV